MGKLCYGVPTANAGAARLNESKAYCEGMAYRASDTAANAPMTDNPHLADSPAHTTWDLGWMQADTEGTLTRANNYCCAVVGDIQA